MAGNMYAGGDFVYSFAMQLNITPIPVPANSTAEQSFNVEGLKTHDQVSSFSFTGPYTGTCDISNIRVSAPRTLTIAFQNGAGAPASPPAGLWLLEINRLEASGYQFLPSVAA